jgi:hypothetical protein
MLREGRVMRRARVLGVRWEISRERNPSPRTLKSTQRHRSLSAGGAACGPQNWLMLGAAFGPQNWLMLGGTAGTAAGTAGTAAGAAGTAAGAAGTAAGAAPGGGCAGSGYPVARPPEAGSSAGPGRSAPQDIRPRAACEGLGPPPGRLMGPGTEGPLSWGSGGATGPGASGSSG